MSMKRNMRKLELHNVMNTTRGYICANIYQMQLDLKPWVAGYQTLVGQRADPLSLVHRTMFDGSPLTLMISEKF